MQWSKLGSGIIHPDSPDVLKKKKIKAVKEAALQTGLLGEKVSDQKETTLKYQLSMTGVELSSLPRSESFRLLGPMGKENRILISSIMGREKE